MKYQEQFLTIWDAPAKANVGKGQKEDKKSTSSTPLKDVFFTIWDTAKHKPTF